MSGGPDPGAMLGAMCCVFLFAIPIGLAVGAVILRSACHMVGVRVPDFLKAMGIVLLTGIANAVASFGITFVVFMALGVSLEAAGGVSGSMRNTSPKDGETLAQLVANFVSLPVGMLIGCSC
ncbi:MAG: hypothetical protein K2R98_26825 [Gemmataceae bacterium]|nr:hypothetical protein [Gemmataceae bacterium]